MISVIIASADPTLLTRVKASIEATIGVPYEVLAFDNAGGRRSICEVYNEGISLARYPVLCLMHEDVVFMTPDWGKAVTQTFRQHPHIGVLGIAGSTFKSVMPIGWPSEGSPETERCNLVQAFKHLRKERFHNYKNPGNEPLSEVVVVDGVWMCVKKEVTDKYRFDDQTFKGFHGYDIDFCLAAGKDHKIAVVYNVLLEHLSEGNWNRTWISQSLLLQEKWASALPRSTVPLPVQRVQKIERHNFRFWLRQVHALGFDKKLPFKVLYSRRILQVVGLKYFLKLHISILKVYWLKSNERAAIRKESKHTEAGSEFV